ncbi:MAG: hypothetical protein LH615_00995 [Ferruginibacter sp.]|nr:hypothetical protein [Ferruginibacter sp.]
MAYYKPLLALRKLLIVTALSFLGIFIHCMATAQSLRSSVSMPYIGAGAYSTKQTDPFSFTVNQAALAQVKNAGVGVYGERRFLLADNSVYAIATAIPTKMGNFGVQVNYAGFQNFNEHKAGLAYGRSLGKKIDIGVQFNYYGYKIPAYSNASTINFEGGAIIHLSEKLNAGIHIYNPVGGNLGKASNEKIASVYKFGLGYDASENFFVSTEIVKEEDQPINVIGSFQYRFKKQFFARAGFRSDNSTGFAGAGFLFNNIRIDVAASYHPQLGISPGLLLMYNFKGEEK